MKNIAVVGSGTMGNGIAHVFAQNDHKVALIDVDPKALEKALATISKNLDRQIKKELINDTVKQKTLNNISTFTSIQEGITNTELVVEAATENVDLKLDIFRQIDEFSHKNAILATNTSSISITKIAAVTKHPDKVIGMHFMNPVPVMKLVEVIKGLATSKETFDTTWELCLKFGKTPAEANDFPGFIANRILMPMINEAIFCLYQSVGSAEDIDTVMKLGMNHPMGPLALADLIGLDTCLAIMETLYDGFKDSKYRPCPLLRKYVEAGWLGRKSGRGFYQY